MAVQLRSLSSGQAPNVFLMPRDPNIPGIKTKGTITGFGVALEHNLVLDKIMAIVVRPSYGWFLSEIRTGSQSKTGSHPDRNTILQILK